MPAPVMSANEIAKLLHAEFPQAFYPGCGHSIERVAHGDIRVRWAFDEASLRPGGTVSGPTMMELADFAMYVAVFSAIGPQPRSRPGRACWEERPAARRCGPCARCR